MMAIELIPSHSLFCLARIIKLFLTVLKIQANYRPAVQQLENRNAVLKFQNKALLNEIKSLKKLYERSNDG